MLRIAVQSKGRLYDETMMLLEEAGIRLNKGKRILLLAAKGFPVEVLFLRDDDIPERPIFTNISSYDFDDDEDDLPMVAEKPAKYGNVKREPLVQPSKPVSTPTYRPAYVPPTPTAQPVSKKPTVQVDTSKVHAGTIVSHKAFGTGQVKGIDGGLIVVVFGGVDKKFQFPGAFEQGFLKLDEDR